MVLIQRLLDTVNNVAAAFDAVIGKSDKAEDIYRFSHDLAVRIFGEWHDKSLEAALAVIRMQSKQQSKVKLADMRLQKLWDIIVRASNLEPSCHQRSVA